MKSFIIAFSFLLFFSFAHSVLAVGAGTSNTCPKDQVCLNNPLANPDGTNPGIPDLIARVIKGALGVVGSIALAMIIWGGFTWMTAAGSSERVTKGRDIVLYAALGLIAIFSAYAILKFIFDTLGKTSS